MSNTRIADRQVCRSRVGARSTRRHHKQTSEIVSVPEDHDYRKVPISFRPVTPSAGTGNGWILP